jgi:hypothetical protein
MAMGLIAVNVWSVIRVLEIGVLTAAIKIYLYVCISAYVKHYSEQNILQSDDGCAAGLKEIQRDVWPGPTDVRPVKRFRTGEFTVYTCTSRIS